MEIVDGLLEIETLGSQMKGFWCVIGVGIEKREFEIGER